MPTVLTHAVIPLAIAWGLGNNRISPRLAAAGAAAAMIPDADVAAFVVGIPYDAPLGHRGASHGILAAALAGCVAALIVNGLKTSRLTAFLFIFFATLSHGLTDMLTNGGRGVGLFWPFSNDRLFFPVRPIEVSPIGVSDFFERGGFAVLQSELLWLVLPSFLFAMILRLSLPSSVDTDRSRS